MNKPFYKLAAVVILLNLLLFGAIFVLYENRMRKIEVKYQEQNTVLFTYDIRLHTLFDKEIVSEKFNSSILGFEFECLNLSEVKKLLNTLENSTFVIAEKPEISSSWDYVHISTQDGYYEVGFYNSDTFFVNDNGSIKCYRCSNRVQFFDKLNEIAQRYNRLSKYINSSLYSTKEHIQTEYGDVLYVFIKGGPHGGSFLTFISNDGQETIITSDIVYAGPFSQPPCNDILLSADGKRIEFNVSIENVDTNFPNEPGTYYYSFDLSTKTLELIQYDKFDI